MSHSFIKERARAQLGGQIFAPEWLYGILLLAVLSAVTSLATTVLPGLGTCLVIGPLSYAISYIFLKQARTGEPVQVEDLLVGFKDDFGNIFLLSLLTTILTALWSILLIIPGVIKAYSWSQVYLIKADNPDYDWRTCMSESDAIMRGHKLDLFLLDFSFIGWYILGSLCIGIGVFWVAAYHHAARIHFYEDLLTIPQVLD